MTLQKWESSRLLGEGVKGFGKYYFISIFVSIKIPYRRDRSPSLPYSSIPYGPMVFARNLFRLSKQEHKLNITGKK